MCRKITELGIALLAVAVVLQIVFGTAVPFIGVDAIGNVTKIISGLGNNGLVGLIAAAVLYNVVNKK
jgi:hypothetical protein